jgi:hypothetical protein
MYKYKKNKQFLYVESTRAWRVLFIIPLRYLFAIGFRCFKNIKHQYLAFDVSLPPLNYLSCSPKQLDSVSILYDFIMRIL